MLRNKFFAQLLLTFVLLLQIKRALCETEAQITNSRHQVSIRLLANDKVSYGSGHICSGTLIGLLVLTSASCLLNESGEFYDAGDLQVAMGNVNRMTQDATTFTTLVTAVKPHSRFNRRTYLNNLALLEISDVQFNQYVVPTPPSDQRISNGVDCYVLGWRSSTGVPTDVLMRSNVKTRVRDSCNQSQNFPFATFCSSENTPTLDSCVGEDGSGLICNGWLRGVVSRDCNAGEITQYTDVSQLYNWIYLSHLKGSLGLIQSDFLRNFVFSGLDIAAYYINTPKIADDMEIFKFLF